MKLKQIENTATSSCIACVIRPLLTFTSSLGPYFINACCPHSKRPSSTVKFVKSKNKYLLIMPFLMISLTSMVIVLDVLDILTLSDMNKIMVIGMEVMFCTTSVMMYAFSRANYNLQLTELNGLAVIIHEFNILLGSCTKIYRLSYLGSILCLLSGVIYVIYGLSEEFHPHLVRVIIKMIVLVLNMLFLIAFFLQKHVKVYIYRLMFKKCFENLVGVLVPDPKESNKSDFTKPEITQAFPTNKSVSLYRITSMYMTLVWNYRYSTAFLQPTMIFVWILNVVLLICQFYILLLVWDGEMERDPLVEIRTYLAVTCLLVNLITTEMVSNAVSFCFICYTF